MNAAFGEALLGARMHGKNDRHFCGDGVDGTEELAEFFGGVHVRGAVERKDGKAAPACAILQTQFFADFGLLRNGEEMSK